MSVKFIEYLDEFIEHKGWSEDDIDEMINGSTIYFKDGKTRPAVIDFESSESMITEISNSYEFGGLEYLGGVLFFEDRDGCEVFINLKNVSMVEMPLLKVEGAIVKSEDKYD